MSPTRDARPLKVLQVDPEQGATVRRYRVGNLAEQLKLAGDTVACWNPADLLRAVARGGLESAVASFDLVILHRFPWCTAVERLLDAARAAGVRTAFEADDLVFVPGVGRWVDGLRHLDPSELDLYDEGVERYAAADAGCDAFIGATPFLAGLRAGSPRPSVVVPNLLGEEQVSVADALFRRRRDRDAGDTVTIAYGSGTATHDADLAAVAPALARVLDAHAHVRLLLVGLVEPPACLAPHADRIERRPVGPWETWWEHLAGSDVAIAPLEERNPYCRAKSGLKALEAGALGLPVVASRIDAYEAVVEDGRTGRLASGVEEWAEALGSLVSDPDRRRALGQAARRGVMQRHTTRTRYRETHATLRALVDGRVDARQRPEGWRGFDWACFIPPVTVGSGGHTVIFRTVRALTARGHPATVLHETDARGFSDAELQAFVDEHFFPTGATWRSGWDVDAGRFDAAMATAWNTADLVAGLDLPARLYFVQDLEHLFFPASENHVRAEATYRLGLSCITIGRWLTEVMRRHYDADSVDFPFLLHVDRPRPARPPDDDRPTVTYFAQPGKLRRAYEMGVAALARLHAAHPEVRIVFFGSQDVERDAIPFPFEDLGVVSEAELEELYLRTDVGLVISLTNPSAVPPNMMRCGVAVVDVDLENNRFEYRDGVDSLLAPATTEGVAGALIALAADPERRQAMQRAAVESIAPRSEPRSMDLIEAGFVRAVVGGRARPAKVLDLYELGGPTPASLEAGEATARFTARHDGLCAVSFVLGTYGRRPDDVVLRLRRLSADGAPQEEVARVILSGADLDDNAWARFAFEPVAGSAGVRFEASLAMMPGRRGPVAVYRGEGPGAGRVECAVGGEAVGPIRLSVHADPDAHPATGSGVGSGRWSVSPRRAAPALLASHASHATPAPGTPGTPGGSSSGDRAAADASRAPSDPDRAPRAAYRVAELLRKRRRRDAEGRRRTDARVGASLRQMEGRLGRVETSLRSVSATLHRARAWLSRPVLRRLLTTLRILPPEEGWVEAGRFVTPELRDGSVTVQRFVAARDGLARVALHFATEGRVPTNAVRLRLLDGDGEQLLRQVDIPAREIADNTWTSVAFEPVADSASRTYRLELTSPDGYRGCGAKLWGRRGSPRGHQRLQDGHRATGTLDLQLDYVDG